MQPPPAAAERDVAGPAVGRLKRRAEFLHVGKGRRWHGGAMSIQAAARVPGDEGESRVGFTLTKKVGNAVVRNRARRRLREAVRLAACGLPMKAGHDYVIVGRLDALRQPLAALQGELVRGLLAVHQPSKVGGDKRGGRGRGGPDRAQHAARPAPERTRPTP